jgi:hypothetical protein
MTTHAEAQEDAQTPNSYRQPESQEEEEEEEEEELHQSSQMRLIRRNTNTRIEYPSTNLETVINAKSLG